MTIRLAVCASNVLILGLVCAVETRAQAPVPARDSAVTLLGKPSGGDASAQGAVPARDSAVTLLGKPSGGDASAQGAVPARDSTLTLLGKPISGAGSFRNSQLENQRVLAASVETKFELKAEFRRRGIPYPAADIYLRAFKREHELEVWVRPLPGDPFILLKKYAICSISGTAGPKRAQGDEQTPEGFYRIDDFNPWSGYHLSLHINYPNDADVLRLGTKTPLGGDIFIHGGCKTIGCLPITDEAIKELYWLSVEARTRGQDIPVHIFPARLNEASLAQYRRVFGEEPELLAFWRDLKRGYDYFEEMRQLPRIVVDPLGRYRVDAAPDKVTRALNVGAGVAAAAVL
jgi:murein L,D-transpeptidase YafK